MKLISKLKYIFPIISIIVLIFFWGKKPVIYEGIFEGMSIIEHIILFILFSISFILQARVIYKKYKTENGKLPIKELRFPIIVVIISVSMIFNILKSGADIIDLYNNVYESRNICEEKIEDFTYNLILDGYARRLIIEYDDYTNDLEKGTYDINYTIKDRGKLSFEFERDSNELIGVSLSINNNKEAEQEYKSPISLQSALLVTWDENTFERENVSNIIMQILIEASKQEDKTIKSYSIEKGDYEISISYFSDFFWEFSINKD